MITNSRTKEVITLVRLKIGQLSTAQIDDGDFFAVAKIVQNDIFNRTKPVLKSQEITLVNSQNEYDISQYGIGPITSMYKDWSGSDLEYISNQYQLERAKALTGGLPVYVYRINDSLFLYPAPDSTSTLKLTVLGYQDRAITEMDETTAPDVPADATEALVLGIAKWWNPALTPEYEVAIARLSDMYASRLPALEIQADNRGY